MPTIKDIANLAGVSHGTVSNVLNGRGNVSAKKIKLVEDAAQKLGYRLNLQAKILKEGSAKTISVILPNITSEQYSNLYDGIFRSLQAKGYELALYLTHESKELEFQFIQKIAIKRDSAVIVVSCLDTAQFYYQTLKIAKDKIIFVYRKPAFAEQFISLDFIQAGRDMADLIMQKQYKLVGLFISHEKNTSPYLFKKGMTEQFKQHKYEIKLLYNPVYPVESTYNQAFYFFDEKNEKVDAIITTDAERVNLIRNANFFGSLEQCPPILTLSNNDFLNVHGVYQYRMNYAMLSCNIVELIEGEETVKIENQGFLALPTPIYPFKKDTIINLLILPSPSTETVRKLLPHFKKITGIDVNLIIKPFDEIYHLLNKLDEHHDIDIIRIDMAGLPWFAKNIFKPLSELDINLEQILQAYPTNIVERFSYIDNTVYAVPFDPSIQLLFYRQDLFNDPLIKRLYFEKYRQHLQIPTNFTEFGLISEFFNRHLNSDSPIKFGSCVTLGNDEIIASEFLLRYYALGGRLIYDDCILLDQAIAIQTLNEFKTFITQAQKIDSSWWQESVKQFEQGNLAMIIVYMNLFSYIGRKQILPLIGYAPVPGNLPLFGGGSLGMSKFSQKNEAVSAFFNWLYSKEISQQDLLLGGGSPCGNIFQNLKVINNYPWYNIIHKNNFNGIRENTFTSGKSIDLRYIENIIGQHISMCINGHYTSEQTIEHLNEALLEKRAHLF